MLVHTVNSYPQMYKDVKRRVCNNCFSGGIFCFLCRCVVEYLYKPLFNIDTSFEEHSYVSLLYDYFNPKFWADILSPICEIRKGIKDVNYFENAHNKMRNVHNDYWGYAQLDPIKRIPTTYDSIRQFWIRYIAPLF